MCFVPLFKIVFCTSLSRSCWIAQSYTVFFSLPCVLPQVVVEVTQLQPVGSSEGCVLLLVNSSLLCSLSLDLEFGRLGVGVCVSVELSLEDMRDHLLPPRVGHVVDFVFSPPLFLQLCHNGTVCILLCFLCIHQCEYYAIIDHYNDGW